jgi:hypothetical protein
MIPVTSLEAGIPGLFPLLHAAKERLEGPVQPPEHILQYLGVEVVVLGPHRFDGGQLSALAGARDTHAAFLPGIPAFLQSRVVEFPTATQHERHRLLLRISRQEFVLEGLMDESWCIHADSIAQMFGLARRMSHASPLQSRGFPANFL